VGGGRRDEWLLGALAQPFQTISYLNLSMTQEVGSASIPTVQMRKVRARG
jgi:hypothetical protein